MNIKESQNVVYRFGEFVLEPRTRVLQRGGERIALTPKAIDVLLVLVQRAGQVVTREELIGAVWPDSYVEESNLTQTVFMLRKALGRDSEEPYIATVQGRGYRFVAAVRLVADGQAPPVDGPAVESSSPVAPSEPRRLRNRYVWGSVAAVTVALIAVLVATAPWSGPPRPEPRSERVMLAVLPFENLTGDAAQEYFSDGMTEEMISQVGKLDSSYLGVIARTSVMRFKGTRAPLDRIGSELGVHYVLEGSVRRDSSKVRVTAQLIRVDDQTHLWSRDYDRELRNLLALERDIAHDIAAEIQLALDERARVPSASRSEMTARQYEAHDAYLKGRYFWNKRTIEGFEEAIKHFSMAIAADPDNARAHAGLADSYALLPLYMSVPQAKYVEKARAAALRALELDERLAAAHTSLALILENHDWDWERAEKEYLRATELDPNYPTAHHWYAEMLTWQGRFEEALIASERARRLDPLSLIIAADNAMALFYSGQLDRAAKELEALIELEPSFPGGHKVRHVYVEQGRFDDAIEDILGFSPDTTLWDLVFALGRAGRSAEAASALERLERQNERQAVDAVMLARSYLAVGDKEQTLTRLEQALAQRSQGLLSLKVDPAWDPLRGEPRFEALLRAVGLVGELPSS